MEVLIDYVNKVYPIPEHVIHKLLNLCEVKQYKTGDYLCKIGEINDKMFFVLEGVTRTYGLSNSNKTEVNKSIATAGSFATSLESAIKMEASTLSCQCLTDSKVIVANYHDLTLLRKEEPEFGEFMYKSLETNYMGSEKQILSLLSKDATERYLELKEDIPRIDQLIPQYQIAYHLGITPIQLSRIKKKLSSI